MNYQSEEFLRSMIKNEFRITDKDFEIKAICEKIEVITVPAATLDLKKSLKEFYYANISWCTAGINFLNGYLEKNVLPVAYGDERRIFYRSGQEDAYSEWPIEIRLFNVLRAVCAANCSTSVLLIGWKIQLLNR